MPSSKVGIRKVEALAEKYTLLNSLLFKITMTPGKEMVVLAILEACVNNIIALYQSSLFAGYQGVIKTYLTISNKFLFQIWFIIYDLISKDAIYANSLEMKSHPVDSCRPE